MSRVERSRREKVTRYSVRKVSFGAASVAVAAFFMFLGNGAVYAAEPNVTATDSALAATPANNQLDENSGASDSTAPKAQADTTTPTPADSSSTSVESAPASKVQDGTPAPTPVAESASVTPAPASSTEEVEEKATSDLDKKQLEDYVAEIDAKLASGSYATKTDESVATLKEHLELAKLALTTAKSQDELTKAYRKLFMTVNSGLRSKPKAQVEIPKLDTTEGKATVGKKASNTEKATESNSIANSGQHDSRNGQALDRNNPFRTGEATTDSDPAANQVFEGTSADDSVEDLSKKLRALDDTVENNKKVSENLDSLGAATGVAKGEVKNINNFAGWKAVIDQEGEGKFAIARKTEKGIFPLETINTVVDINNNRYSTYLREQALDRTSDYMLYLSEVRTKASENETTFDGKPYRRSGLGSIDAPGIKGYNGIEKTFKAYSPTSGSKVQISFITGYSGDINGTKAKYHVQVFTPQSATPIYDVTFDPQRDVTNNPNMTVQRASDGSSVVAEKITTQGAEFTKEKLEEKMSQTQFRPNGSPGKFTSKEIDLPAGVTEYTVRISSADNQHLGMGYQSIYRHYALPISGLDFHVTQDTGEVAKELLKKIYLKLKETEEKDKTFKTAESQKNYEAELQKVSQSLNEPTKSASDYKNLLTDLLIKKQELANSDQEKYIKSKASDAIDQAKATKDQAIDANDQLSPAEKAKAKEATKAAADLAKAAIEGATDQATVSAKEAEGTKAIQAVSPVGKENAKNAIDQAKATKDQAIDTNDQLSPAEKAKAKEATKAAADEAKKAIDAATDQAGVDAKATEGTEAVAAVNPVGKDKAKAAVDAALAEKDKAIDANDKLSDAEKSAAKEEAKAAADEAKKAIDAATDQAGVDTKEAEGKAEIAKVTSAAVEVGKSAAKAEIEKAAKAKEAAINANDKLSDAEKSAAKAQVAAEAKKAIEAIEKATTEADVEAAKEAGKAEIAKVAPETTDYKAKAKAEVEAELAKKLAELENATDLTEAEKAAAKAQVVNKAKEAIEAIQKAATEADVDQAIRNFVYRISAVIREQEEYDLSKLFVNGSVTVKQGESLTDKDVLSKLNLPSGVEIVKVEKPTTSVLGTVMAKVTVKLADGSVEEINVPVEVIVSQNHGNEGNGGNNGATNTDAKVDKAKLEGAIHQLDELLLKESAKLDAETAKEANVLSADAKKVFANADATQVEVDAMVKRIEDFMAKVAPLTDHANTANDQSAQTPAVVPANNQSAQTTVVAPATTQAAANASQTLSAQANARKAAKELPNTGTADSTVAMVAAAASALLGLGLAGRRRKEDEEA